LSGSISNGAELAHQPEPAGEALSMALSAAASVQGMRRKEARLTQLSARNILALALRQPGLAIKSSYELGCCSHDVAP
jgi:hypothetical protein